MNLKRLPLALALSVTIFSMPLQAQSFGTPDADSEAKLSKADKKAAKEAAKAEKEKADALAEENKAKEKKEKKEKAETKDGKDSKEQKETKASKDAKEPKDAKESKDGKEAREVKDSKEVKEARAKGEGKTAGKAEAKAESKAEAKAEAEKKNEARTAFIPDDALISVLKDLDRALADSQTEQVAKIENVNQKMILGVAQEIFSKALKEPNLTANRILARGDEQQARGQLTAESWSSGDVEVNDKLHGSMSVIWAKRIGGLMTVTIAGDAGARKTPDGATIGEFMVVLTAHSPVQKGFDIQSQGDVTFWIGKLNNITIEASCVPTEDAGDKTEKEAANPPANSPSPTGGESKKKLAALSPLLTNRYRQHYALLLAADLEAQRVVAELAAAADPSQPEPAKNDAGKGADDGKSPADARTEGDVAAAGEAEGNHIDKSAGIEKAEKTEKATPTEKVAVAGDERKAHKVEKAPEAQVTMVSGSTSPVASGTAIATINSTAINTAMLDAGPLLHMPSASSTLLMPDKALAGQYVTVAMLDRSKLPEANVELRFNGASFTTDSAGQAVYQIPEDTAPGRSLNIAMSSRPDEVPVTVEVYQALNAVSGVAPRLDRLSPLAVKGSIMTVEGHNFDGLAHNNSVIVDGSKEGRVIAASPFQLKLLLPEELTPGPHSLCISTDGMRSNLAGFDFADTVVNVEGRDNGKENCPLRLVVKVIGTTAKMNVKILNQTPDVVRLNRGAEMTVTSAGGFENTIILPAVRGKKGPFRLDTQIEM